MRFAEWKKLGKEEKIKQASSSIIIGSEINYGDNTEEFINLLKDISEISKLDLLIEGSPSRQRAVFAVFTKYLANDQHLSKLTIGSTFQKDDFFSNEKHYGEFEIFKALATNTSLTALEIGCYNITLNDIETLIASIRKNSQSKLQKITFLYYAWFNNNKGNQDWQIEKQAINDYLAIRPLEITLTNTIDKFEACASALSPELITNLTKIFEELKKYDEYRTSVIDSPAVNAIKAVVKLADTKKYLVDDYNKLTKASQGYEFFNTLPDPIEINLLDTNQLISLIDRLIEAAKLFSGTIAERLNQFKTKITSVTPDNSPGYLLETEYEDISDTLQTLKSSSHALAIRTYQELADKYPVASQALGNMYFTKIDPKYKVLAALYFFQAGMDANKELLRACQQLILTTFTDKLNIDNSNDEQLNYFLKLQFNLQTLLKDAPSKEVASACHNVLTLLTTKTTIESKKSIPKQEIAEQLEDLNSVFPKDEKLKKSCEVIIKHVKEQQPKPDDMTVPDRDKLYAETQKYLEEYSPKFGKSLSDAEKEKQPLYYAVAAYVRILLELSDPIIDKNEPELYKRLIVAKKLWNELPSELPFHQEVKKILEQVFTKYINNFSAQNPKGLLYPLKEKTNYFPEMFWYWRQSEVESLKLSKQLFYLSLALKKLSHMLCFLTWESDTIVDNLIFTFVQQFAQKLEQAAASENLLKHIPLDWIQRHTNFKAAPWMKKFLSKEDSSTENKKVIHLGKLQIQITKLMTPSAKSSLTKFFEQERAIKTLPPSNPDHKNENNHEGPAL